MRIYKCLNQQVFESGDYKLVPIRCEDRYKIMQWRNEQIYHLRQAEPLTKEKQDEYFENVVASLFDQKQPDQILFSFLQNEDCIGYGGLVHINWVDRNAEISFIMKTELERGGFGIYWNEFYFLLEKVAFKELDLNKLYTYAFDLRPNIYELFENFGFVQEARLKKHVHFRDGFIDVVIHGKLNDNT